MTNSQKTKILYFITGLHTGGAEVLIRDMVERINNYKFSTVVVSILPLGDLGQRMKENGIRVISLEASSKFDPFIIFRLYKALKSEHPDILHTHLFHADFLGRIVGRLAGVPKIISTIHNIDIGGKMREILLSATKSFIDKNIAVSDVVARSAVQRDITKKSDVMTIYNGVDVNNFPIEDKQEARKKNSIPQGKDVFVSVGSLTKQKGYKYLIDAIASTKTDTLFIVLGEGNQRAALEKRIIDLKLEDRVLLKGRVNNVNDYLQAADYFIMSSLWEGFSVALLEAALAGKVIIATNVGGNTELIHSGKTGFLCKSENSEVLAKEIKRVINLTASEKEKISKAARLHVIEKFSIKKMIVEHQILYSEILNLELR